jgi:hypothetical protein
MHCWALFAECSERELRKMRDWTLRSDAGSSDMHRMRCAWNVHTGFGRDSLFGVQRRFSRSAQERQYKRGGLRQVPIIEGVGLREWRAEVATQGVV